MRLKRSGLYVVIDKDVCANRNIVKAAKDACEGGADIVQLRDKTSASLDMLEACGKIKKIAQKKGVKFIVNDRIDIALASGAHGVHLGQTDLPIRFARKVLGPGKIIGISASNMTQARIAAREGADYIGLGPVFATRTKRDAGRPIGVKRLRAVFKRIKNTLIIPIGGIKERSMGNMVLSGARWIAVAGAATCSKDVKGSTRRLKERLNYYIKKDDSRSHE